MPTIPLIRSKFLSAFPNIVFAMSTRQGADDGSPFGFNLGFDTGDDPDRVESHLRRFLETVGLAPDEIAFMEQVHETRIAVAVEGGEYPACDALCTDMPRIGLAVRTADCFPVFLYDPKKRALAAIHAGWRGTAGGIVSRTVAEMTERYGVDPSALVAFIGPGAGPCCYEVGPDVASLFPADLISVSEGERAHLDLRTAIVRGLTDMGVRPERIEAEDLCTICTPSLFHSHRRDGPSAGRMLGVIAMIDEPVL
ncbi:MAG: peptidoglycan editing factor PgeF [Bacteroidota bacterium]|nr:peptidoglycan editing factor PgeF [Bacteroidota bacterium]